MINFEVEEDVKILEKFSSQIVKKRTSSLSLIASQDLGVFGVYLKEMYVIHICCTVLFASLANKFHNIKEL